MDIQELLLGREDCACGRPHRCPIEAVSVGAGVIAELDDLAEQDAHVLLVADENTYAAAGAQVEAALGARVGARVIFPGKPLLILDERAIARVRASLAGITLVVGIGSGVIQDLCKYISFFEKIPYIIVATAPSMDGYASSGAAMILSGMKETVAVGLPRAIVLDTNVLKNAPMDMIRSGYGDIIGKYSSLCDWHLGHAVDGEYYCPYIDRIIRDTVEEVRASAAGLLRREEKAIEALARALVVVGITLAFVGNSRPASGSEHHLSHFFEIVGIERGEDYLPHGTDVAYAAVITARLREELCARAWPKTGYRPTREEFLSDMDAQYGRVAAGCVALQDKVGNYEKDRVPVYLFREKELREILSEMPSSAEMEALLSEIGFRMPDFYAFYGEGKIQNAIRYAKDLKDRYTVLWMYYDLFGGE